MNTTISIEGMHCKSCVALLTDVLEELDGVTSADVDLARADARVTFDEKKVGRDELVAAIEAEGYGAK